MKKRQQPLPVPPRGGILGESRYDLFRTRLKGSDCRECPLWENRTNIVVDRGSPAASFMAVGEAPGEREDLEGLAFVGRAGRLLDRLLGEAGVDAGRDLLIVNVVKCRPPGNRAPTRTEAEACLPYLRRQIELARPRAVLLLGATALRHLFRGRKAFSMKERVGKTFRDPDYPGIEFAVLYHPAFILRNPSRKGEFLEHLRVLRETLEPLGRWPGAPS